jgi:hypothetical protein
MVVAVAVGFAVHGAFWADVFDGMENPVFQLVLVDSERRTFDAQEDFVASVDSAADISEILFGHADRGPIMLLGGYGNLDVFWDAMSLFDPFPNFIHRFDDVDHVFGLYPGKGTCHIHDDLFVFVFVAAASLMVVPVAAFIVMMVVVIVAVAFIIVVVPVALIVMVMLVIMAVFMASAPIIVVVVPVAAFIVMMMVVVIVAVAHRLIKLIVQPSVLDGMPHNMFQLVLVDIKNRGHE